MAWEKSSDGAVIVFYCDTCDGAVECEIKPIRERADRFQETDKVSDFAICWKHIQVLGWKSFKRTGHSWTYHCPTCVPAAEEAHTHHRVDEAERDRIKAKNAS